MSVYIYVRTALYTLIDVDFAYVYTGEDDLFGELTVQLLIAIAAVPSFVVGIIIGFMIGIIVGCNACCCIIKCDYKHRPRSSGEEDPPKYEDIAGHKNVIVLEMQALNTNLGQSLPEMFSAHV